MKFYSLFIALVLIAFALVQSLPLADPNVKCDMNCDLQEDKPICGTDDAGETKTFRNICILRTENCLRASSFQKTLDGACP